MRQVARVALLVAALGGAAIEVWAVRSGWFWGSAAADLLAGWGLLAAAGWANSATPPCRALLGLAGAAWFAATPQVVGGSFGHAAALMGGLWLAPLATALLGFPHGFPARRSQQVVVAVIWIRALPNLAGIGWLTAVVGGSLAVVAVCDSSTYRTRAARAGGAAVGAVLCVSGVVQVATSHGSSVEALLALTVAASGFALAAFRPARAETPGGFAGIVIDLGRTSDAHSLERSLALAVGDPKLRLLYRLAPDLPYVAASGSRVTAHPLAGRVLTVLEKSGSVTAAIDHDAAALLDPKLRQAVLAVGALAVQRMRRAAEATRLSIELARSRQQLVEAERLAREKFGEDVAAGPDRLLADCLTALEVAYAAAPDDLRTDVAAARETGTIARRELAEITRGSVNAMLARRGLGPALVDLAASAGLAADVRLDDLIVGDAAALGWFVASEGLTNALKHAGPARIWLTASTDHGRLRIEVGDDGLGGANLDGHGLGGLRQRLAAAGAHLEVTERPFGGTLLVADIPRGASAVVAVEDS